MKKKPHPMLADQVKQQKPQQPQQQQQPKQEKPVKQKVVDKKK